MASGAVVAGEVVMAVVQTTQHARSTGLNIKQAQSTANYFVGGGAAAVLVVVGGGVSQDIWMTKATYLR